MTPAQELELLRLRRAKAMAESPGVPEGRPPDPEAPGPIETYALKASEALPLGRPLRNTLGAIGLQGAKAAGVGSPGARLTKSAAAQARLLGIETGSDENAIPGPVEGYRQLRDSGDALSAAGGKENPVASVLGTGTGIGLSLLAPWLPKVKVGAGAGGRVLSQTLTGAGYGAANAAANGKADLTKGEVGQFAKDVVGVEGLQNAGRDFKDGKYGVGLLDLLGAGAVGGGLTGGAIGGAMEGARASGGLQKAVEWVKQKAINSGRKVLTNGADQLSTRNPVSENAVEEAIRSKAIRPLGTNQGTAERLGGLTDEVGEQYAKLIAALEKQGVKGPDARLVADQLLARGASLERNTLNNALPQEYLHQAESIAGKAGPQGELSLSQAENLKRSLQKQAKYGRVEETPLNEVRRDAASVIRQANEDAVAAAGASDRAVRPLASQFEPVKRRLGALLEAEGAATRGAARGATRTAGDMGLKSAAAAVAAGQPSLIAAGMASNLVKNRLPSTIASYGLSLSDILGNTAPSGKAAQMAELIKALKRMDEEKK